jgi:hypothetical protein
MGTGESTYNLSAPSTTSLGSGEDDGVFQSLTDLKWGEFQSLGLGSGGGGMGRVGDGVAKEGGIEGRLVKP